MALWLQNAMLLALVSGQDRSTVARWEHGFQQDGCAVLTRGKTGVRIAIPLELRMETVARNGVTQDASGNWVTAWVVADMSAAQIAALLADAKESQTALVSAACQSAIVAAFTSSALGAAHTYPAKPTDQQNLNASVVASLLPGIAAEWTPPFWCATQPTDGSDPVWFYLPHTVAQIQQVGTDGKAAIPGCLNEEPAACRAD